MPSFQQPSLLRYCSRIDIDFAGLDPVMHFVINCNNRCKSARPETPCYFKAKTPVLCSFADIDAEFLFKCAKHIIAAANIAGRTQTNADKMFAARDRCKK